MALLFAPEPLREANCSIGSWVGPSSPTAILHTNTSIPLAQLLCLPGNIFWPCSFIMTQKINKDLVAIFLHQVFVYFSRVDGKFLLLPDLSIDFSHIKPANKEIL